MDNTNNNFGNMEGDFTYPAPDDGASVQDTASYTQGAYPQPPEWTKNIVISSTPWPAPGDEGNVSVRFNESEKEVTLSADGKESLAEEEPEQKREWPMWIQIGIVVLAAVVAFVLIKYALQVRISTDETTQAIQTTVTTLPVEGTAIPTTVPATSASAEKTTDDSSTEEPTAKIEKTTAENEEPSSASSVVSIDDKEVKKEVIEYFNKSSNRVKTEAVKVVKNFEKRTHNEDKLELPSAIKGVAKSVLESKITDITEPTEYPSREAIIARYPAPGAEWSSQLTQDDVAQAVCVETDDEYEITLVLNNCVDPEPGKGTSKAMECLDVPTVRDTAPPFITAFSAEYYDCVIRCRVEKATGRIIWSNYTTPVLLKLGLDAGFVKFDMEIGLTFEKDYTITY